MSFLQRIRKYLNSEEEEHWVLILIKKIISTWIAFYFIIFFIFHRYSEWLQQNLIFLNHVCWPFYVNFNKPLSLGMVGVRNLFVRVRVKVHVGTWQILPYSYLKKLKNSETWYDEVFADGKPVIIYVHGNSGTRVTTHRLHMYKVLRNLDCHVVAFDYRGYGDSTDLPVTEEGVVEDTVAIVKWVAEKTKNAPMYLWGHSLGAAVTAESLNKIEGTDMNLRGVILEAPFNNLKDACRNHPVALIFKNMFGYDFFVTNPIYDNGFVFQSDEYLSRSKLPVLILHAEDDWILPIILSRRLYQYLLKNRKDGKENVKLVEISSKNACGHKYICTSPKLQELVRLFIDGKLNEIPSKID